MITGQLKQGKKIYILLGLMLILCSGQVRAMDKDPRMTGLPELTDAELQWQNKHMRKVKKVKLNQLGLERVNQWRRKKGRAPVSKDRPAPKPGKDLEVVIGESASVDAAPSVPEADMPGTIDNSQLKYFPPIRSQGALNSCGAFSGVYYAMTYMHAMAKDLDAKNGGDHLRLSPKWAYNMVNGGSNAGSWYYWAYEIGQKHGAATWHEFPYDSNYRAWNLNPDTWLNALYRRFDQYGYVANTHTDEGISQVKQMLLNGYVLNIPTYINSWQWSAISDDPSTPDDDAFAGKSCVAWVNGTQGYHAMTVVGYNDSLWVDINRDDQVDDGEKGAFLIANSWGTGWGDGGFAWMAYDALKNPSAVVNGPSTNRIYGWSPSRAHWVTARPDYQPKVVGRFTLNHLKRDHLRISLGSSEVTVSEPQTLWTPKMIYNQGGAYGFSGTTSPVTGTFVFDLTDLLPSGGGLKTYYLNVQDDTSGDAAALSEFAIVDLMNGGAETGSPDVPQTVDGEIVRAAADYNYFDGNIPPTADAGASALSGIAPLSVAFDGSASTDIDGTITSYGWDFGDGAFQTGAQVEHLYENAGMYTAVLTVTDNNGATDSQTLEIEVLPDPSRVVFISDLRAELVDKPSGKSVRVLAQISDNLMNPVSNALVQGRWSGLVSGEVSGATDGSGLVAFNSRKTKRSGTIAFSVESVTVSGYTYDPSQNTASSVSTSTREIQNQMPVAMISAGPLSGQAPFEVTFDGSGSYDPDGSIAGYEWDFGDGNSAYGPSVAHVFYDQGTYPVTLTVTDNQGGTHSSDVLVAVLSGTEASMQVSAIEMDWAKKGPNATGKARVRVTDADGRPVANALVTANWSGIVNASVAGTTDSSGSVLFSSEKTRKSGQMTLSVENITAPGFIYTPENNIETRDTIEIP